MSQRALPPGAPPVEIDAPELSAHLAARFSGQVLTTGQKIPFEFKVRQRAGGPGGAVGSEFSRGLAGCRCRQGRQQQLLQD